MHLNDTFAEKSLLSVMESTGVFLQDDANSDTQMRNSHVGGGRHSITLRFIQNACFVNGYNNLKLSKHFSMNPENKNRNHSFTIEFMNAVGS